MSENSWIQVSYLAIYNSAGFNISPNVSCTTSSVLESISPSCDAALNGAMEPRNASSMYQSQYPQGDWFKVDLLEETAVERVEYYNRLDCCLDRAQGSLLQLLDANGVVFAQRTLNSDYVQTFEFSLTQPSTVPVSILCEMSIDGGGWALVRRVAQGSVWHPATDDLHGLDVYGTYATATSPTTFSIDYSKWLSPSTQFLFMTGMYA